MIFTLMRVKLKQAVGTFGRRAVMRFLMPDLLVGVFLVFSKGDGTDGQIFFRLATVAGGVSLFTLIVEARKLFFTGGDIEDFYFVQPTIVSRLSSLVALYVIDVVVVIVVAAPTLFLSSYGPDDWGRLLIVCLTAICFSGAVYLFFLCLFAYLPARAASPALTILQIVAALGLLAVFQLPQRFQPGISDSLFPSLLFLLLVSIVFVSIPVQENLISKLSIHSSGSRFDILKLVERGKRIALIGSDEEEAGFVIFLSHIFRNESFRLSTIGVAATPIMVAIYWSMLGVRFMSFSPFFDFITADAVAPISSLVVSGILVHYFLCQGILNSRDSDAKWIFGVNRDFEKGKFIHGVRKAFLLTVHVPLTALIFFVLIFRNPFAASLLTALTFYFLTHIAATGFSIMQRQLPFTLPFTQIGSIKTMHLIAMLGYSFLITLVLYFSYGNVVKLLMVNAFAFILVGILENVAPKIINNRAKFGV